MRRKPKTKRRGDLMRWWGMVQEIYPAVRMEMEYVVYDSNPELDRGWAEG